MHGIGLVLRYLTSAQASISCGSGEEAKRSKVKLRILALGLEKPHQIEAALKVVDEAAG